MKSEHLEFKIGVVTFVGLLILISLLFFVDNLNPFGRYYRLRVGFPDVEHLMAGAEVSMAGVRIGRVESLYINLEPSNSRRVIAVLEISDSYKIPSHAVFRIAQSGVFGNYTIRIQVPASVPSGEMSFLIPDSAEILLGEEPVNLDSLIRDARTMMVRLDEVMVGLQDFLGDPRAREDLKITFFNLSHASKNLKTILGNLENSLPEGIAVLRKLALDIREIVSENRSDIREGIRGGKSLILRLDQSVAKASSHFVSLAKRLDQLSLEIHDDGNLGRDVKTMRANLIRTSENLKRLSNRFSNALDNDETENTLRNTIEATSDAAKTLKKLGTDLDSLKFSLEGQALYSKEKDEVESSLFLNTDFRGKYRIRVGAEDIDTNPGLSTVMAGVKEGKLQISAGILEDHGGLAMEWFPNIRLSLGIEAYGTDKTVARAIGRFRLSEETDLVLKWHDFNRDPTEDVLMGISHRF